MNKAQQPAQEANSNDTKALLNAILSKIKKRILKYAPVALFALWAVLLWALFAAKLTKDPFGLFDANLYRALKDETYVDLFPILKALLSFAVISNVYAAILAIVTWKCNEKPRIVTNCGGVLLQIAVFICALLAKSKIVEFGLEHGSLVPVVASFTGAFAALQVIYLVLIGVYESAKPQSLSERIKSNLRSLFRYELIVMDDVVNVNVHEIKRKKHQYAELYVCDDNPFYYSTQNCVIQKSTQTLVVGCINSAIPANGSVLILGEYAFAGNKKLKELTIPKSVHNIQANCFENCRKLQKIIYCGSMAEWKQISKNPLWNERSGIKHIICTDGTIEL